MKDLYNVAKEERVNQLAADGITKSIVVAADKPTVYDGEYSLQLKIYESNKINEIFRQLLFVEVMVGDALTDAIYRAKEYNNIAEPVPVIAAWFTGDGDKALKLTEVDKAALFEFYAFVKEFREKNGS